jgi:hypothetical protein
MESDQSVKKKDVIVRVVAVLIASCFWMIYRIFYLTDTKKPWNYKYCFEDRITTYVLGDITNFFSQNLILRDFLLITSSNMLDVFLLSYLALVLFKSNSWVQIVHPALFYFVRNAIVQPISVLRFYDTYIVDDPGFPSLVVPFFRTSDFFYSGHVGCCVLLALQFKELGYEELFYAGMGLSVYEAFAMTITRSHYSVDILFGILMAHYTFFIAKELGEMLDRHVPICLSSQPDKTESELQEVRSTVVLSMNREEYSDVRKSTV